MLVPGASGAEGETDELPGGAHDDNPAEADPLVEDSLEDVKESGDTEENREDDGTSERGVKAVV